MRTVVLCLLGAIALSAQVTTYPLSNSGAVTHPQSGTALPGACTQGDFFFLTSATAGQNLYGCTSTNTWTLQGVGAGSSTYTATGTGAVARTITSKLGDAISALDYGADPTGTTDSGTAIQKCINAAAAAGAGGGTCYVPAGTYTHAATLTKPRTVRVVGAGQSGTIITYTGSTRAWIVGDTLPDNTGPIATIAYKGGFEGLVINGPSGAGTATGVYMGADTAGVIDSASTFANNESWENVQIANFGVGTYIGNNAYIFRANDVSWTNNGQHFIDPGHVNSGEGMEFINCEFGQSKSTTKFAVELDNSTSEYYFSNTNFDYNSTSMPDLGCTSGAFQAGFHNVHFEKAHGQFIKIDTTNCNGGIDIDGGWMIVTGSGQTDPSFIQFVHQWDGRVYLAVRGTRVYDNETLTTFVDAPNTDRWITLDSLQFEDYNTTNMPQIINDGGNHDGVTITNTVYGTGSWGTSAGVVGTGIKFRGSAATYDFSTAAHTLPMQVGVAASKPATCTAGEQYFATDATAGQNVFGCTGSNTWTLESGAALNSANTWTGVQTFAANPTLAPTNTATSSVTNYPSQNLYFNSSLWNSTGSTAVTGNMWLSASFTGTYGAATQNLTLQGSGSGATVNNSNFRLNMANAGLDVINSNDGLGVRSMETWSTGYIGLINTTGSAQNPVPANGWTMFLGISPAGKVGTVTPISSNSSPTWRNVLDDGSGNAILPKIRSGTASNADIAGQLTLASGTASYTFAASYTSAPICTATDTTAISAVKVATTTTALTITGTGTDAVNYICIGRN